MALTDKYGTRLGPEDGKPDVVLPDPEDAAQLKELSKSQKAIQQNTKEMAQEIAKQNGSCARKLLFEFVKALIVAFTTLAVEHIFDLWRYIEPLLHAVPPITIDEILPTVMIGIAVAVQMALTY